METEKKTERWSQGNRNRENETKTEGQRRIQRVTERQRV